MGTARKSGEISSGSTRFSDFPCSGDHEQDWQPSPVDPYSAICDDHTYIHSLDRVGFLFCAGDPPLADDPGDASRHEGRCRKGSAAVLAQARSSAQGTLRWHRFSQPGILQYIHCTWYIVIGTVVACMWHSRVGAYKRYIYL